MKKTMKSHIFFFFFLFLNSISAFPFFYPNITDEYQPPITNYSDDPWQYFMNFSGCHAGDHALGLSKLKQYFHHFGYIPEQPLSNFTDDFDDAFESALKTYQLNFNLHPTGTLDEPTLRQIVRPRCGVADVINGSTTMKSGKPSKSPVIHSIAHYAFFPGQPRWPPYKQDLTYAFFPGNQLSDSVKAVFKRAFSRWAAVTPLTFKETLSYNSADLTIGFFVGNHGDGEPFDGVLGTLAHAFSPPDGRFHLDGAENWVVEGDVSKANSASAVDLESVAVHEIGHLLGLGHSSVEQAIMFPTISSGAKKVELARDDIDGIQFLYGGNPSYRASGSPTSPSSQERETSHSGAHRLIGGGWVTFVIMPLAILLLPLL